MAAEKLEDLKNEIDNKKEILSKILENK